MNTFLVKNVTVVEGEVDRALIVQVVMQGRGADARFGADHEREVDRHELANLVAAGEQVCVIIWNDDNTFDVGSRVRRKAGPEEYLFSIDAAGNPDGALLALPSFIPTAH